jgi:hypothetical protein
MTDDRPKRERKEPNRLDRKLSKEEGLKRKLAEYKRHEKNAVMKAVAQVNRMERQEQVNRKERQHRIEMRDRIVNRIPVQTAGGYGATPEPLLSAPMVAGPGAGVRAGQVFQIVEARGGNETGVWHGDLHYRRAPDWTDEQWECFKHALDGARDDDQIEAAIQVVGHGPAVVMAYPAAAAAGAAQGGVVFEDRISAIEYTLLAKIRDMTPSDTEADRIEVLEQFLLLPAFQGRGNLEDRMVRLEAAAGSQLA